MGNTHTTEPEDAGRRALARGRRAAKARPAAPPSPQIQAELRRCQREYAMELARHSSHISSALGMQSTETELELAVARFTALHGDGDLPMFLVALADRVESRGHEIGLAVIQHKLAALTAARADSDKRQA